MSKFDWVRLSLLASLAGCGSGLPPAGTTGASAGTTGESCPDTCVDPVELADGIVQCANGEINRIRAGTYDPTVPMPACPGPFDGSSCVVDEDCLEGGTCVSYGASCGCVFSCSTDADCDPGSICLPAGMPGNTSDWSRCIVSDCAEGCGECGSCGLVSYTVDDGCGGEYERGAAVCRDPEAACAQIQDCSAGEYCSPPEDWSCVPAEDSCATIGRPLLIEGEPRTAPACWRGDWAAAGQGFEQLEPSAELAARWASVAALEHASVASFARFGAQLLALGAPAQLLRACKRAALDEVEHARLAYGLASAYGGVALGPASLALAGVTLEGGCGWREVVAALITEACVSETLGVVEGLAQLERTREAAVRAVLERIVQDELRHAQLAWRSLQWCLSQASSEERAWALALLRRALDELEGLGAGAPELEESGVDVLSEPERARLFGDAGARVIAPLAQALGA